MTKDRPDELVVITQKQLDDVIAKHEAFKGGKANGARAVLLHHDLSGLNFGKHDLSNADFSGSLLVEANFEGTKLECTVFYACDLRKANFRNANMIRTDLRGACLRGAVMAGANLSEADLREGAYATFDPDKGLTFASDSAEWKKGTGGVDLRGANLGSVKLSGAIATNSNFEDANLSKSVFIKGNLTGANLAGANLEGADLSQCEMKDVSLRGANLTGVLMDFSNLDNVDLSGALTDQPTGHTLSERDLPLDKLIALHQLWLKTKGDDGEKLDLTDYDLRNAPSMAGANLTMLVAERAVWYGLDLCQINLQAATLRSSDFRQSNLSSSDLRGSNFNKCNMVSAKFVKARLEPLFFDGNRLLKTSFAEANLRYSDFTNAVLRDADFSGADLSFANFTGADTTGADFSRAIMKDTIIRRLS